MSGNVTNINERFSTIRLMLRDPENKSGLQCYLTDNFSGLKPLTVRFPARTKVWGAAVGHDKTVVDWFRDAKCEPPDWNLLPNISQQTITIAVPGSASAWKVNFYDTRTGTDIIASATLTQQGSRLTIALPDFTDDIASRPILWRVQRLLLLRHSPPISSLGNGLEPLTVDGTARAGRCVLRLKSAALTHSKDVICSSVITATLDHPGDVGRNTSMTLGAGGLD